MWLESEEKAYTFLFVIEERVSLGKVVISLLGEYIQVSTTVERREDGERIAKALIEARLAACVQIVGPILSTYWWQGAIEKGEEWLLLIKTESGLYPRVEEVIHELHPYDLPEVIAVPLVIGSRDYLDWMRDELVKI